jgi:hypothetical protein
MAIFNVTRFSSLGFVAAFLVVFSGCGFAQESLLKTISRLAPNSAIRDQSEPESGSDLTWLQEILSAIAQ